MLHLRWDWVRRSDLGILFRCKQGFQCVMTYNGVSSSCGDPVLLTVHKFPLLFQHLVTATSSYIVHWVFVFEHLWTICALRAQGSENVAVIVPLDPGRVFQRFPSFQNGRPLCGVRQKSSLGRCGIIFISTPYWCLKENCNGPERAVSSVVSSPPIGLELPSPFDPHI